MSDVAIRVENLSKRYRIGESIQGRRFGYKALRDVLTDAMYAPFRRLRSMFQRSFVQQTTDNYIWALKDVSFEVKRGEVVGIIGRNGAGKTTLLKILSRITEPTEGYAEIRGRVGSLLEVGTGFHPELTGRENIYLNGAILGMKRAEIERKFDEIVDFAEIEKFIDTPVKHYSSGMYVRLAFAVAAHLEPEILLVDEVLAVGDAAFQKKCLGKMGDVAKEGRTVLFVSHNVAAIRHMCPRTMLIHNGQIVAFDNTPSIVGLYERTWIESRSQKLSVGTLYEINSDPRQEFQILKIEMLDENGRTKSVLSTWDRVKFRIHYYAKCRLENGSAVFQVRSLEGVRLLLCSTQPDSNIPMTIEAGKHYVDCEFPSWPLAGGRYLIGAALAIPNKEWLTPLEDMALLEVEGRDVLHSGMIVPHMSRALMVIPHSWLIQRE